jgi:hypothetical protein
MRMTGGDHQRIGPWRRGPGIPRQRQAGAATLVVAVIMQCFSVFGRTSGVSVLEQKTHGRRRPWVLVKARSSATRPRGGDAAYAYGEQYECRAH